MKRKNGQPRPAAPTAIETLGGAYHRLESTFRLRNKAPVERKAGAPKKSNVAKEKRKAAR